MNYNEVLQELGITQEDMDKAKATLPVPMLSNEESNVYFGHSAIEGNGTFALRSVKEGELISPLLMNHRWTLTGMMTNHSDTPNARLDNNNLIALKDISKHDEVTCDYLQIKEVLL